MHLPDESRARAEYYLARILNECDITREEACRLEQTSKKTLHELLSAADTTTIANYMRQADYPVLFDHIVPWDYRITIPRKLNEPPTV